MVSPGHAGCFCRRTHLIHKGLIKRRDTSRQSRDLIQATAIPNFIIGASFTRELPSGSENSSVSEASTPTTVINRKHWESQNKAAVNTHVPYDAESEASHSPEKTKQNAGVKAGRPSGGETMPETKNKTDIKPKAETKRRKVKPDRRWWLWKPTRRPEDTIVGEVCFRNGPTYTT
ncbi:Uncharacterized protein Rs2_27898 [Raphanus sativus]|nr:Uncharacterized protein Rs2_27898 [Raphanus sativus]